MANNKTFVQNSTFTVADSNTEAFGSSVAGTEIVRIRAGVTGVKLDANFERIELSAAYASYKFVVVAGTGLQIQKAIGNVVVATIPNINQDVTLAFTDGSATLHQSAATTFTLNTVAVVVGVSSDATSPNLTGNALVTTAGAASTLGVDTFSVYNTGGVVTFDGSATGNITFTLSGTVATFTRGGIQAATTVDFSSGFTKITLDSQTLAGSAASIATSISGKVIDGSGTIAITSATTSNAGVDYLAQLKAINAAASVGITLSSTGASVALSGSAADLAAALDGINTHWHNCFNNSNNSRFRCRLFGTAKSH